MTQWLRVLPDLAEDTCWLIELTWCLRTFSSRYANTLPSSCLQRSLTNTWYTCIHAGTHKVKIMKSLKINSPKGSKLTS